MPAAVEARAGGQHSGNWDGLISNPGIQLAHDTWVRWAVALLARTTGKNPAVLPDLEGLEVMTGLYWDPVPATLRRRVAEA